MPQMLRRAFPCHVQHRSHYNVRISSGSHVLVHPLCVPGLTNICSSSLKDVYFKTTNAVRSGEVLQLQCDYDLENAQLYSIKWYFNDDEFYRYIPKESPPTRVFPKPGGVSVDLSRSDNRTVILSNVRRNQTGYYKCEVTADAPLFHTDIKKALIYITEVPNEPPKITTEKIKILPKEIINASCVSTRSYPRTNLTWFINGEQVKNDTQSVKITYRMIQESEALETSQSQLQIITIPGKIFKDGKLRLRCQATQFHLYKQSTEIEIINDAPQLALLSPKSNSKNCHECISSNTVILTLSVFILLFVINR